MTSGWARSNTRRNSLQLLIGILILLGISFRFINLSHKVYWHDEVYTSIRAAGFTRYEIDQELFQNRLIAAPELQKFQRLKPGSTAADTVHSLITEDPQHPPLYFLMARFWMQWFGSSRTASRMLPALLSLLALPLMYGLALELFVSQRVAWLATALLAISPFDVLFAQTARQYSFLTVLVIGSSYCLLRALRLQTWQSWVLYTLASTLGLYTHPFFSLTLSAHVAYATALVISQSYSNCSPRLQHERTTIQASVTSKVLAYWSGSGRRILQGIGLSLLSTLFLYSPWLLVMLTNQQRALAATDWTRTTVEFLYLLKLWILSFTALFLDLDFGFNSIWTYLLRLPVVLLIALAIERVWRCTSGPTRLFIVTSIFVPFMLLALPDLLLGGKRSAVSRYLISCYPGVQLAIAYFLSSTLQGGKRVWHGILALLLTGSIASCTVSAFSFTWWNKDLSYFNHELAERINAIPTPLVISDLGDDFTNTGDLISLSYTLHPSIQFWLLGQPPQLNFPPNYSDILVFRPSGKFHSLIQKKQTRLELTLPAGQLWQLRTPHL